jgi:hypothetical protein
MNDWDAEADEEPVLAVPDDPPTKRWNPLF